MITTSIRLVLGSLAVLLLSNCVALDDPYYGGNYSSGYSGNYYNSAPYYGGGYYNRPYYGGGYYGGGYYGHNDRDHDDHYGHDHGDDHQKSSSSRSSSSSSSNRSASGQLKNDKGNLLYQYGSSKKGAPEGNHTKDWYAQRGYDLDKIKPSKKPAR